MTNTFMFQTKNINGYTVVMNTATGDANDHEHYFNAESWLCCVNIDNVLSLPEEYYIKDADGHVVGVINTPVSIKENGTTGDAIEPSEIVDYFKSWRGIEFKMPEVALNEENTSIENWALLENNKEQDGTVVNMSVLFKYITDNVLDADAMLNDQAVIDAFASIPSQDEPVADRTSAVQAVSDVVTANKATHDAYVTANDSAVAVERGRIDTMLNGAGVDVDVDTLAELSTKIDNAKALLDTEDTALASDIADLVASRAKFTLTGSASYTQAHGLGGKDVSVEFFETDGTTNTKITLGYTVDATNITFTAEDTSKTYIVVAQKF